jgi:mRNA-degrading endonuclease HigB of HigAB toxin-antitoxin module
LTATTKSCQPAARHAGAWRHVSRGTQLIAAHLSWPLINVKARYRSASVLQGRRVVFNIEGNEYRLIVAIAYRLQIVYVKFIGTHAEYDAVDADNVEPIGSPDPVEAIKFRMDQVGLTVKDLEPLIGCSHRVYAVLNHKRPLTLAMMANFRASTSAGASWAGPNRCVSSSECPAAQTSPGQRRCTTRWSTNRSISSGWKASSNSRLAKVKVAVYSVAA